MRLQAAILAGLSIIYSSIASPAMSKDVCSVHFEVTSTIVYSEHNLEAIVYRGYYGGKAFSLVEDDGFLTLAILYSTWQSEHLTWDNLTKPVRVRSSDILLAQRAGRIGIAYYATLIELLRAQPVAERKAGYAAQLAGAEARMAAWARLVARLDGLVNRVGFSPTGMVELPVGFMKTQIGVPILSRVNVGADDRWELLYGDSRLGPPRSLLCDPKSPSILVGRVFCARHFANDSWLGVLYCPEGLLIPPVSKVRFCQDRKMAPGPNGEVRIERVNCTNGVGGPAVAS